MTEGSTYRSRCRIYADILRAIQDNDSAKMTYLLHAANLSYERLTSHIGKMKAMGLIENGVDGDSNTITITLKGRKYLVEFRKLEEFGETFGISV